MSFIAKRFTRKNPSPRQSVSVKKSTIPSASPHRKELVELNLDFRYFFSSILFISTSQKNVIRHYIKKMSYRIEKSKPEFGGEGFL